jgi:hypothetical protein
MSIFNALQQQFYIFKATVKELNTKYSCIFCQVNTQCYCTPYGIYFCETSYKQIQMYTNYIILMHEFTNFVDYDCKNYIVFLFNSIYTNIQCVADKKAVISLRNKYLALPKLELFTLIELKLFIAQRNILPPDSNCKSVLISVIKQDIHKKYGLWRTNYNYPLYLK